MATPKQVVKSVGPKLVPFFKTVAIYFVLFIPSDQPSLLAAGIKCLPILSLIAFVLLHGMSLGEEYAYSRRVLLGLVMSVVGDALLVWDELFIHGLVAFLFAQVLYISAFGFRPFNVYVAAVTYSLAALGIYLLLPGTSGVVSMGLPLYTVVLMTMVWRAVARVQLFQELWTWTKLCSCLGGVLFAVSDGIIGFNTYCCTIPHSQAVIMVTYYAAQLGISLSVVDSKASYLDSLRTTTHPTTPTTARAMFTGPLRNRHTTPTKADCLNSLQSHHTMPTTSNLHSLASSCYSNGNTSTDGETYYPCLQLPSHSGNSCSERESYCPCPQPSSPSLLTHRFTSKNK